MLAFDQISQLERKHSLALKSRTKMKSLEMMKIKKKI